MALEQATTQLKKVTKEPTLRQKKLAKNLVLQELDRRWNLLRDLLVDAGYSLTTAQASAKDMILSPGVQTALAEYGFTSERAKAAVAEILATGQANERLKAAELVFKVTGDFAPEKKEIKGLFAALVSEVENDPIIND